VHPVALDLRCLDLPAVHRAVPDLRSQHLARRALARAATAWPNLAMLRPRRARLDLRHPALPSPQQPNLARAWAPLSAQQAAAQTQRQAFMQRQRPSSPGPAPTRAASASS
jgi:hypothetical protein